MRLTMILLVIFSICLSIGCSTISAPQTDQRVSFGNDSPTETLIPSPSVIETMKSASPTPDPISSPLKPTETPILPTPTKSMNTGITVTSPPAEKITPTPSNKTQSEPKSSAEPLNKEKLDENIKTLRAALQEYFSLLYNNGQGNSNIINSRYQVMIDGLKKIDGEYPLHELYMYLEEVQDQVPKGLIPLYNAVKLAANKTNDLMLYRGIQFRSCLNNKGKCPKEAIEAAQQAVILEKDLGKALGV